MPPGRTQRRGGGEGRARQAARPRRVVARAFCSSFLGFPARPEQSAEWRALTRLSSLPGSSSRASPSYALFLALSRAPWIPPALLFPALRVSSPPWLSAMPSPCSSAELSPPKSLLPRPIAYISPSPSNFSSPVEFLLPVKFLWNVSFALECCDMSVLA